MSVPLVLHGASGIPNDDVMRAVSLGVAKVNIHAELGMAAMDAIREDLSTNFVNTQIRVREALKQRALEKIELLGATGRASAMPMVEGDYLRVPNPSEAGGSCT